LPAGTTAGMLSGVVEAQRGHVQRSMTQGVERCRLPHSRHGSEAISACDEARDGADTAVRSRQTMGDEPTTAARQHRGGDDATRPPTPLNAIATHDAAPETRLVIGEERGYSQSGEAAQWAHQTNQVDPSS